MPMAGVVGFEPTNLYKKIACLVGRCYQPLNQTPITRFFFDIREKQLKKHVNCPEMRPVYAGETGPIIRKLYTLFTLEVRETAKSKRVRYG